jgi:hypothetical protein
MKTATTRVNLTVNHEMRVALEVLAGKSGLPVTTQAMVLLRQALDRTINSESVQLRIKEDRAFRTRDQWLLDAQTDAFVHNAMTTASGEDNDAPTP